MISLSSPSFSLSPEYKNELLNGCYMNSKQYLGDKKAIENSDKDKQDWENFLKNKEKIPNKDYIKKKNIRNEKIKKIDLHS